MILLKKTEILCKNFYTTIADSKRIIIIDPFTVRDSSVEVFQSSIYSTEFRNFCSSFKFVL